MPTRLDVLQKIASQLYPLRVGATRSAEEVDFHLLGVMLLLCTRGDVLERVFPSEGPVNPDALYDLGVSSERVPKALIEPLRPYRELFAGVQIAWLDLSGYTDPPCPPDSIARQIVDFTKQIPTR